MVQGLRTKTRKGPSVHVDYVVHIQEIKPWPPSQSLKTIRAALIQWEHGDKNSGSTNQVVPSVDEGRIEFNESFKLNVTLTREISSKNGNGVAFQKNCIEFNLYEPRRDKTGQLLGTAVVDLSEYGIARESLSVSAPINCKRTYGNTVQPLLFLKIEPAQKSRQSLRLRSEASMDRSNCESFSALTEECAEDAEMDSFVTDDDVSSHSSLVITSAAGESNGSSSPLNKELGTTSANGSVGESKSDEEQVNESQVKSDSFHSSCSDSSFSSLDRLKRGKSVRSSPDLSRSNGPFTGIHVPMTDAANHAQILLSDSRIQHLENRIKNLEGELRESAAIEASLYSVVAEHGSSITKVHAPARRLSRLYFHDIKQNSKSRRGAAAKSIVSGLVLVSKACGNDVPRLTFWLSNCIVLRVIMSKSFGEDKLPVSVGAVISKEGNGNTKTSSLKWESLSSRNMRNAIEERFGDWENPLTFVAALEKVEAWIFARIVESIWWQTFTPHMQLGNAKEVHSSVDSESSKLFQRKSSSVDQQQGSFSLEHWKMAFRDACEMICPLRAGGHDCGCLPVLSRVIMEQLVARLDVAMFNAILRESADDIPTDPVADPISDPAVLPIPSGKSSFGAGAQLKNAIGNWSRWLTDIFGIDDGDLLEDNEETACDDEEDDDERPSHDTSSKCFRLLNALSDLMMLPKDLLLSRTVRKEVCPTFGAPIIRRVLNSFSPDEFCPDQIPVVVLEALNSEDPFESEDNSITNFPCAAAPISYQPPSAASVATIVGDISNHSQLARSRSSVLRKSQTSDDELDELDSPLKSIILDSFQASPSSVKTGWSSRENGSRNALRYQLLRDVWMNCD